METKEYQIKKVGFSAFPEHRVRCVKNLRETFGFTLRQAVDAETALSVGETYTFHQYEYMVHLQNLNQDFYRMIDGVSDATLTDDATKIINLIHQGNLVEAKCLLETLIDQRGL